MVKITKDNLKGDVTGNINIIYSGDRYPQGCAGFASLVSLPREDVKYLMSRAGAIEDDTNAERLLDSMEKYGFIVAEIYPYPSGFKMGHIKLSIDAPVGVGADGEPVYRAFNVPLDDTLGSSIYSAFEKKLGVKDEALYEFTSEKVKTHIYLDKDDVEIAKSVMPDKVYLPELSCEQDNMGYKHIEGKLALSTAGELTLLVRSGYLENHTSYYEEDGYDFEEWKKNSGIKLEYTLSLYTDGSGDIKISQPSQADDVPISVGLYADEINLIKEKINEEHSFVGYGHSCDDILKGYAKDNAKIVSREQEILNDFLEWAEFEIVPDDNKKGVYRLLDLQQSPPSYRGEDFTQDNLTPLFEAIEIPVDDYYASSLAESMAERGLDGDYSTCQDFAKLLRENDNAVVAETDPKLYEFIQKFHAELEMCEITDRALNGDKVSVKLSRYNSDKLDKKQKPKNTIERD